MADSDSESSSHASSFSRKRVTDITEYATSLVDGLTAVKCKALANQLRRSLSITPSVSSSGRASREDDASDNVLQPSDVPSVVQLPYGWKSQLTVDGRVYFYNTATRITQWTQPHDVLSAKPATSSSAAAASLSFAMPASTDAFFSQASHRSNVSDQGSAPGLNSTPSGECHQMNNERLTKDRATKEVPPELARDLMAGGAASTVAPRSHQILKRLTKDRATKEVPPELARDLMA